MAGSGRARLVKCPKCKNVLPEQDGFSVYQCGGCGTVLRAKSKFGGSDTFSEKPDKEDSGVASEKSLGASEKSLGASKIGGSNPSDASDSDIKQDTDSLRYEKKVAGWKGNRVSDPEDDSWTFGSRLNHNAERIRSSGENGELRSRIDSRSKDLGFRETLVNESIGMTEKWVAENGLNVKLGRNGLGLGNEESRPSVASISSPVRFGQMPDQQARERSGIDGFHRNFHYNVHRVTLPTSKYPDEGSSVHHMAYSSRQHEMQLREPYNVHGSDGFRSLYNDRAALLRKIDDLKDQLNRSCHMVDHAKGNAPFDRGTVHPPDCYAGSGAFYSNESSASSRGSRHSFDPQNHAHETPYHRHDFVRHSNPSRRDMNCVSRLGDPYDSEMQYYQYSHHQDNIPYSDRVTESNSLDPLDRYSRNQILHHPSCSCLHCYNDSPEVPAPLPPNTFKEPFLDGPKSHLFHDSENQGPIPLYNSHKPQYRMRSGGLNSQSDGLVQRLPQRAVPPPRHLCPPIAGAAPFLTCHNCFELLQLPKKLLKVNQQKIRCGGCSTTISCIACDKKLVFSFLAEAEEPDLLYDSSFNKLLKERHGKSSGSDNIESNVNDFNNSECEFHSVDKQSVQALAGNSSTSAHPSSPSVSGDQFSGGNLNIRSSQEKVKAVLQQEYSEEESVATEMEVSFNEYSNTRVSHDSSDMSREDGQPEISEAGLMTLRSLRDFSRSSQSDDHDGAISVSVNGHVLQYSLIKRAEKLAGPICPGDYWYDFRAGFWGAMGGPCLGIILPFIEEFNYAMAKDCAGGTTDVLVNRRELHQRDLDLLSMRGLPTDRGRSYIVEISGRVLDEETGEELESLGKLAPTVEKVNCGFGMKVPREVADELSE